METSHQRATQKYFIVACPRSGTTLLQSLLASHPDIVSFPESHFFECLISDKKWLTQMGIASRYARARLLEFIQEIDDERLQIELPRFCYSTKQYVRIFVGILDRVAQIQDKHIWLEKTPGHIKYIGAIEQYIPQARFIHIIRNGCDVVASLYEVSNKYPQDWGGGASIDDCIEQWNLAVEISKAYRDRDNHLVVSYEEAIANPRAVLPQICQFMSIDFMPQMLVNSAVASNRVILEREPWKQGVRRGISDRTQNKFERIFDSQQRAYIKKQLLKLAPQIGADL